MARGVEGSTGEWVRLTVKIKPDVKEALKRLQNKRTKERFVEPCLRDLLLEGALLLLEKEGVPVTPPQEPPRKPVKPAKNKRVAVAVQA